MVDGGENGIGHHDLGELEDYGAGVMHNPGPNFDELELQARQRSVGDGFEPFIDRGNGEGGFGPEEAHKVKPGITGDHRVQDISPSICAMDVTCGMSRIPDSRCEIF